MTVSILITQITKSLEAKYNVKQVDNTFNILDVASTEKNDLLDMLKETNYSTVMLVEIFPVHYGVPECFISIHLKILNIKDKKYLYNGKIWRGKSWPRYGLIDINIELDKIYKIVFKL